jgi:hypothetical protein
MNVLRRSVEVTVEIGPSADMILTGCSWPKAGENQYTGHIRLMSDLLYFEKSFRAIKL